MKQAWHPDELTQHWTLSDDEYHLLGEKTGATRLAFAVLLKAFQYEGRFPLRRDTVPVRVLMHLATQVAVPLAAYATVDWDGRSARRHRAEIRTYCGYDVFTIAHEGPAGAFEQKGTVSLCISLILISGRVFWSIYGSKEPLSRR